MWSSWPLPEYSLSYHCLWAFTEIASELGFAGWEHNRSGPASELRFLGFCPADFSSCHRSSETRSWCGRSSCATSRRGSIEDRFPCHLWGFKESSRGNAELWHWHRACHDCRKGLSFLMSVLCNLLLLWELPEVILILCNHDIDMWSNISGDVFEDELWGFIDVKMPFLVTDSSWCCSADYKGDRECQAPSLISCRKHLIFWPDFPCWNCWSIIRRLSHCSYSLFCHLIQFSWLQR